MSLRETIEVKTVLIVYLISFLFSLKIREVEETNKKKKKNRLRNGRKKSLTDWKQLGKRREKVEQRKREIYSESTNTLDKFAQAE